MTTFLGACGHIDVVVASAIMVDELDRGRECCDELGVERTGDLVDC